MLEILQAIAYVHILTFQIETLHSEEGPQLESRNWITIKLLMFQAKVLHLLFF